MEAESKVSTRRLISRAPGKAKSPAERYTRGKGSVYHVWLEMLRSTPFETGDSYLETPRAIPSESLREA